MENNFKFVMPANLEKGEDGSWTVAGLASTGSLDQQGETIMQKGIDLSPIDQKRGILNWDHQKGPENTIGTLDGYKQTENGLFIKGRLFKQHSKAKAVQEIMSSLGDGDQGRMGLSVEGQILERDANDPRIIKKCKISAVALTMNPVNSDTYADIVKSMNASDIAIDSTQEHYNDDSSDGEAIFTAEQVMQIVKKALGVGEGYTQAPNKLTDGDSMATSDKKPDGKKKKKKEGAESADGQKLEKKCMKSMSAELYKSSMLDMLEQLQQLYPGSSRTDLWNAVKTRMETKFPDVIYPEK
tara:strand:+ start:94066 stop:94959 length:894 start_codon:yes stop_codon:yes gene_type:complete